MRNLTALLCLVFVAVACDRSETTAPQAQTPEVSAPTTLPVRVSAIELGKAIGADGRVTAGTASFSPADTIYVSIVMENPTPSAMLSARWLFEDGQLVSEGRETVASTARAATEFHIAKPDGLPAGRYRVEIALNGEPAGAREFEVR